MCSWVFLKAKRAEEASFSLVRTSLKELTCVTLHGQLCLQRPRLTPNAFLAISSFSGLDPFCFLASAI